MSIRKDRLDKAIIHLKPMSYFICNFGGIWIDSIFKIEDPDKINEYLYQIGIEEKIENTVLNKTKNKPDVEIAMLETIEEINMIYKEDFQLFNYPAL